MTLYQYKLLDDDAQANELWANGIFLCERAIEKYNLGLYALYGFYVEVWFHLNKNKIVLLRTFKNATLLDAYLQQIDISEIIP